MTNNLVIIGLINESFSMDSFSIYYNGHFDDIFTEKIISIATYEVEKKSERKLSFLISESFQNIVRHGDANFKMGTGNLFGLRGNDKYVHIFSANPVSSLVKDSLESKLDQVNALDKEELKRHYLETLSEGELSKKGGAGLGLIQMVKKTDRPLQYAFQALKDHDHLFSLQIDLPVNKDQGDFQVLEINENIKLHQIINEHRILFLYKGDFGDDVLSAMLTILKENIDDQGTVGFSIFHTAVELMQNINRHGIKDANGKVNGVFSLQEFEDGYYLSTGNKVNGSMEMIRSKINTLNKCTKGELDELYRTTLKESLKDDTNAAGVGLIDVRRITSNKIDVLMNNENDYIMIGMKISKK